MQLTKAVKNISESAMSNSNEAIKFAHLLKIINQSMLHGAHVKEMAKTLLGKKILGCSMKREKC